MTLKLLLLANLALFCLGLYAVLVRRHLIGILVGVELMLNAAMLNFMGFARFTVTDAPTAQVFVLFIIGFAAAEAAIALSIVVALYRRRHTANADQLLELRG